MPLSFCVSEIVCLTVSVGIRDVVSGRGVVVVLVDVEAGVGIVVGLNVRMRPLDPVVQDGDGDALAGGALLPSVLNVHVQPVSAVQIPHLRPSTCKNENVRSMLAILEIVYIREARAFIALVRLSIQLIPIEPS